MCLYCGMSLICFKKGFGIIKQLLPLSEGDMTICSPSTGNIALGLRPWAISPASVEQIVMSPSLEGNNCIIEKHNYHEYTSNSYITLLKEANSISL